MPDLHILVSWSAAAAFAAAACWCLYKGLAHLFLKLPQSTWTPVRGKIRISGVDEFSDGDGGTNYKPVIEYEYDYKGVRFLGDRIAPLQWGSTSQSIAEETTRRYPAGREVRVYVNPANPGKSVLEPRRQVFDAICYCVIGLCLVLAAFVFGPHR